MKPEIFRNLSYGMYAIGVKGAKGPSACIANSVVQITSQSPTIVALSMNHNNYSHACITENGLFTVSVLSEDTAGTVIGTLGFQSGRDTDKLKSVRHKVLLEGVPVIKENTCCWFLCKVISSAETPTHTVFLAEVVAGSDSSRGEPMTYSYYHRVIKGSAPQNAPTYLPPEAERDDHDGERWVCPICGYVHDNPKVPFEELPEDWVCPICGAPKSLFRRA